MAQHPIYYPDPNENLRKLDELITLMTDYGLLHEQKYGEIECLLSAAYPQESYEINLEEGNIDEGDTSEFLPAPNIFNLYEKVKNKEQFIQDYRNAISIIGWSDVSLNNPDLLDTLVEMRDINYYLENIVDR